MLYDLHNYLFVNNIYTHLIHKVFMYYHLISVYSKNYFSKCIQKYSKQLLELS
jgi:hypothetical protein